MAHKEPKNTDIFPGRNFVDFHGTNGTHGTPFIISICYKVNSWNHTNCFMVLMEPSNVFLIFKLSIDENFIIVPIKFISSFLLEEISTNF